MYILIKTDLYNVNVVRVKKIYWHIIQWNIFNYTIVVFGFNDNSSATINDMKLDITALKLLTENSRETQTFLSYKIISNNK